MDIRFDGKTVVVGKATVFTNPAIEAGVIHGRALLEFLGFKLKKGSCHALAMEKPSRKDDRHLGHVEVPWPVLPDAFSGLQVLEKPAEEALAYLLWTANKGLAHSTGAFTAHENSIALLELSMGLVRELMVRYVYQPLGQTAPPPTVQIQRRVD
ncbi:hypothetical protein [Acidovorax lacteus]|uniref:hypothetical protein n=1 Tax=Acidovorax lacteus TaxID=1924988 RepID=UPI0031E73727